LDKCDAENREEVTRFTDKLIAAAISGACDDAITKISTGCLYGMRLRTSRNKAGNPEEKLGFPFGQEFTQSAAIKNDNSLHDKTLKTPLRGVHYIHQANIPNPGIATYSKRYRTHIGVGAL
jgi:hypothetical protein